MLYHKLRRNHLGISYQSFPHSLHRHSKTLLNSKGHSMSGSRIIKSLCQEDQCDAKEGLNKLKQCRWRRFFFWPSKEVLIQMKTLRHGGTITTIQYLEGMICILPNLEKKSWKMFPPGTEGKTKSHHFVLVFV